MCCKHNNRALDGRIDSVLHSRSQLCVERLEIVVDRILVCGQGHFLDDHNRRFVNRQHMSLLPVAVMDALAGLHIPQCPTSRISIASTMEQISYIPDDSHICSGLLADAAAAAVVVGAVAAALALSASVLLPAVSSAALIVESEHEGAFAGP